MMKLLVFLIVEDSSDMEPASDSYGWEHSSHTTTDIYSSENTENLNQPPEKPADRKLYDWLILPLEKALANLEEGSRLVIIPDKILHACPFPYLRNAENARLGSRFGVTVVPSIFMLEQVCVNQANHIKLKQEHEVNRIRASQ